MTTQFYRWEFPDEAPPPEHPASYYTGPLGENNILPADADGALFGLWSGWSGASQAQKIARLEAMQDAAGRTLDVVGHHYGGGGTFGGQSQCAFLDDDTMMDWTISNGSAVYLTWTPNRWTGNSNSVCRQIIDGDRDACIDAMADHLAAKGVRVMLRPLHEFDFLQYFRKADNSLDYATEAAQGQAVIDAFQYLVGRFQTAGASNVGFFWCPDEGGGSRSMVGLAYPGDAYVDWVGSDRYNHNSGSSACNLTGWADFYRIFNHTSAQCSGQQNYHDRFGVANGKPVFVGETSTRYDSGAVDRKNTWYEQIALAKNAGDTTRYMSNLVGVCVFDQYVSGENNSDWRIDSNQTAAMAGSGTLGSQDPAYGLNGWIEFAQDPLWNVGVA